MSLHFAQGNSVFLFQEVSINKRHYCKNAEWLKTILPIFGYSCF